MPQTTVVPVLDLAALPVFPLFGSEVRDSLQEGPCVKLVAPTGSGKSIVAVMEGPILGQELYGRDFTEVIAAQPTRATVRNLANTGSRLHGVPVGQRIGMRIAREVHDSPNSETVLVSYGLLRRKLLHDGIHPNTIYVLDEAHSDSVDAHLVMGLLRRAVRSGLDIKIIVASATPSRRVMKFFEGDSHESEGRLYECTHIEPEHTEAASTAKLLEMGHNTLTFVTGKEHMERVTNDLAYLAPGATVLHYHSELPRREQIACEQYVPEPGERVCVVATPALQDGTTLPYITAVACCGECFDGFYDRHGIQNLYFRPLTRREVVQQIGRASRTAPGFAIFQPGVPIETLEEQPVPELKTACLSSAILDFICHQEDLSQLPLPVGIPRGSFERDLQMLQDIGCVFGKQNVRATPIGKLVNAYGIDTRPARMVAEAQKKFQSRYPGITYDMATIAAIIMAKGIVSSKETRWLNLLPREGETESDLIAQLMVHHAIEQRLTQMTESSPEKRAALFVKFGIKEQAFDYSLEIREGILAKIAAFGRDKTGRMPQDLGKEICEGAEDAIRPRPYDMPMDPGYRRALKECVWPALIDFVFMRTDMGWIGRSEPGLPREIARNSVVREPVYPQVSE